MTDHPFSQPLAAIASQVRSGNCTSLELVQESLRRIRSLNGELHCFTKVLESESLAAAVEIDRKVACGIDPGLLAGIPFACKDLFDVAGLVTTAGAKNRLGCSPANSDAEVVRRLKNQGAILMGTLNMDEYAYGFATINAHFGTTRNPHDFSRLAGGSSGGSASAVSAGLVPFAIGSDTNGSIRVPAGLCGLFGIRPADGKIPMEGVFPFVKSLDTVGPFTRSTDDLELIYRILSSSQESLFETESQNRSIRIARLGGWFQRNATAEVLDVVKQLMTRLDVQSVVELPEAEAARSASFIMTAAQGGALHLNSLNDAMSYDPAVRDRFLAGTMVPFALYSQAVQFREFFRRQLAKVFKSYDLLIAPCTPCVAPKIEDPTIVIDGKAVPARANLGLLTQPLSIAGMPILSVPCVRSAAMIAEDRSQGLPIGIQIATWPGREDLLFTFARRLERDGLIGSCCPIQYAG